MRIRNVSQEYEAKLEPSPTGLRAAARGKAEWKRYADGSRQCKLSASNLDLPDGATLGLLVDNRSIAQLTVQHGTVRYRMETERGESVPVVELGQVLRVVYLGQIILEGQFYAE